MAACCSMGESKDAYGISLITGDTIAIPDNLIQERHVEYSESGISVTYHIEEIKIEPDNLYEGTNFCRLKGFGQTSDVGTPSLPIRIDEHVLPLRCDTAVVSVTHLSYREIRCAITPARPMGALLETSTPTYDNIPQILESLFDGDSKFVVAQGLSQVRDKKLLQLLISPCQYNHDTQTLRVYTDIEYTVSYPPIITTVSESPSTISRMQKFNSVINSLIGGKTDI